MTDTTPGKDTSEFQLAKSAGFWGVVSLVLGAIISIGSSVLAQVGESSTIGIIIGGVVAVAGVVTKTLASLGYTKSRTEIKTKEPK